MLKTWLPAAALVLLLPGSNVRSPSPNPDRDTRVMAFVEQLIDSMPGMVQYLPSILRDGTGPIAFEKWDTLDSWAQPDTMPPFQALVRLTAIGLGVDGGYPTTPRIDAATALDSLRSLWGSLDPRLRSFWLLRQNGATALGSTLVRFAGNDPARVALVDHFSTSLGSIAAQFRAGSDVNVGDQARTRNEVYRSVIRKQKTEEHSASVAMLKGEVALARGDTGAAIETMLPALAGPISPLTAQWADRVYQLTDRRPGAERANLIAATVRYLKSTWNIVAKDSLYSDVLNAFQRFQLTGAVPPDVLEPKELTRPKPASPDVEEYLDRQFWVFFDYAFAVGAAPPALKSQVRERLIVGEFLTGIG